MKSAARAEVGYHVPRKTWCYCILFYAMTAAQNFFFIDNTCIFFNCIYLDLMYFGVLFDNVLIKF